MFCSKCGQELEDNAQFCSHCGAKVGSNDSSVFSDDLKTIAVGADDSSSKSRLVAAVLCWFLGFIGGHCYYVGKTTGAIFMTIFFWTGIPAIIAFVQFILILCGCFKDKDGLYLKKW